MIRQGKKAIHFDLDGTLIDSVPDLALALNEMLRTLGRETFNEETIRYWVGNGAQTLVKRALLGRQEIEHSQIDEAYFKEALGIFLDAYAANLCEATSPYPGVLETLTALKQRGYHLSIITNKPEQFVAPILEGLGFGTLIEHYLGGDSLPRKKPNPLPLLKMCELMGVGIDESVMVGDSKNDILAANACGMQSIGVTYGYNYAEDIRTYSPTVVIDNFEDILKFL
jgi:phosphoglycolate phosphatase